jgi:uncharacterized membrane protein
MKGPHIIAGLIGLASGAVALYALKGGKLHRQSGMIFVYAMLFVSSSGAVMAALKPQRLSLIAGVLTFYLVMTALLTVRRRIVGSHWIDLGAMLVALAVGIASIRFGLEALSSATGKIDGMLAAPVFGLGAVALLAALLDVRMMAWGIQRTHRIARHLWRMCFALFIAATSFFLGQTQGSPAHVFPEPLRNSVVLAIPVVLVLLLMFYWLARVLFTQWQRRVPEKLLRDSGPAEARLGTDLIPGAP